MLHKSRNKSFTSRINTFKLRFFLTKTEEITTSLTPWFLQFNPILIILVQFLRDLRQSGYRWGLHENDSIRFIIHYWRQDIVIQLLGVCTTERSKDRYTIFKFFVKIISSNSFYMTFYITHYENFTANCKKYEFFLGNSRWYIKVVFYFAQYLLYGEMCFYYQLEFSQVYQELYLLVLSSFDQLVEWKTYCSI